MFFGDFSQIQAFFRSLFSRAGREPKNPGL
jgi:hypothetical protein